MDEKRIEKKYLTVKQVADELNMSVKGVQRLCREGKIGSSKPGKNYLIPPESLDGYLKIIR